MLCTNATATEVGGLSLLSVTILIYEPYKHLYKNIEFIPVMDSHPT